jgi:hypothetical protein
VATEVYNWASSDVGTRHPPLCLGSKPTLVVGHEILLPACQTSAEVLDDAGAQPRLQEADRRRDGDRVEKHCTTHSARSHGYGKSERKLITMITMVLLASLREERARYDVRGEVGAQQQQVEGDDQDVEHDEGVAQHQPPGEEDELLAGNCSIRAMQWK